LKSESVVLIYINYYFYPVIYPAKATNLLIRPVFQVNDSILCLYGLFPIGPADVSTMFPGKFSDEFHYLLPISELLPAPFE